MTRMAEICDQQRRLRDVPLYFDNNLICERLEKVLTSDSQTLNIKTVTSYQNI